MILSMKGKTPVIEKDVFIAVNATVIGDVWIREGANIWYGAVIRGDTERIVIGEKTNIQDNCTVHADPGCPALIGSHVTVGHNSVLHGCTVESHCLIGMNAVVLNHAVIKTGSLVAAGSVVPVSVEIGPFQMAAGSPATVRKDLEKEATLKQMNASVTSYVALAKLHQSRKDTMSPCEDGHRNIL